MRTFAAAARRSEPQMDQVSGLRDGGVERRGGICYSISYPCGTTWGIRMDGQDITIDSYGEEACNVALLCLLLHNNQ
jgi:hypothetical protein